MRLLFHRSTILLVVEGFSPVLSLAALVLFSKNVCCFCYVGLNFLGGALPSCYKPLHILGLDSENNFLESNLFQKKTKFLPLFATTQTSAIGEIQTLAAMMVNVFSPKKQIHSFTPHQKKPLTQKNWILFLEIWENLLNGWQETERFHQAINMQEQQAIFCMLFSQKPFGLKEVRPEGKKDQVPKIFWWLVLNFLTLYFILFSLFSVSYFTFFCFWKFFEETF